MLQWLGFKKKKKTFALEKQQHDLVLSTISIK